MKEVEVTCAAFIPPIPVDWIWNGNLAAGKLTVMAGAPGTGKTLIALNCAAIVSNGEIGGFSWPDGTYSPAGNVLIWSGEDGVEDTIIPRLIAANGGVPPSGVRAEGFGFAVEALQGLHGGRDQEVIGELR